MSSVSHQAPQDQMLSLESTHQSTKAAELDNNIGCVEFMIRRRIQVTTNVNLLVLQFF